MTNQHLDDATVTNLIVGGYGSYDDATSGTFLKVRKALWTRKAPACLLTLLYYAPPAACA